LHWVALPLIFLGKFVAYSYLSSSFIDQGFRIGGTGADAHTAAEAQLWIECHPSVQNLADAKLRDMLLYFTTELRECP